MNKPLFSTAADAHQLGELLETIEGFTNLAAFNVNHHFFGALAAYTKAYPHMAPDAINFFGEIQELINGANRAHDFVGRMRPIVQAIAEQMDAKN